LRPKASTRLPGPDFFSGEAAVPSFSGVESGNFPKNMLEMPGLP